MHDTDFFLFITISGCEGFVFKCSLMKEPKFLKKKKMKEPSSIYRTTNS